MGHGANYGVQTVIVGERTAVFGDVGELAPRTLARPPGVLAWGRMRPELMTRQRPQSAMRIVPPLADDPHRVSINRTTARSAHTPPKPSSKTRLSQSAIRLAA